MTSTYELKGRTRRSAKGVILWRLERLWEEMEERLEREVDFSEVLYACDAIETPDLLKVLDHDTKERDWS